MEWVIIILLSGLLTWEYCQKIYRRLAYPTKALGKKLGKRKRFRAISYCPECKEEMSFDELEDNLKICPYCGMYDCSLKIKVGEN